MPHVDPNSAPSPSPPQSGAPAASASASAEAAPGAAAGPGGGGAGAAELVATLGAEGLGVVLEGGGHVFHADGLPESGGQGAAPNPFRLLLGALGSCTAMTIRMYADRKQWPLEGVRVVLGHDRRRAEPGETGATDSGWIFTIDKQVELIGDALDESQRARLLDIGERCPVNLALQSQVRMIHGPGDAGGAAGNESRP